MPLDFVAANGSASVAVVRDTGIYVAPVSTARLSYRNVSSSLLRLSKIAQVVVNATSSSTAVDFVVQNDCEVSNRRKTAGAVATSCQRP